MLNKMLEELLLVAVVNAIKYSRQYFDLAHLHDSCNRQYVIHIFPPWFHCMIGVFNLSLFGFSLVKS